MYRKLKESHNEILRRLLDVLGYISARTMFVNKRQDNEDVRVPEQCYIIKLRISGSYQRVIKSIFHSCFFKA